MHLYLPSLLGSLWADGGKNVSAYVALDARL
jgi:hypothetical protein